jgi:hypothetical protein
MSFGSGTLGNLEICQDDTDVVFLSSIVDKDAIFAYLLS